jgi:hypothetical protein
LPPSRAQPHDRPDVTTPWELSVASQLPLAAGAVEDKCDYCLRWSRSFLTPHFVQPYWLMQPAEGHLERDSFVEYPMEAALSAPLDRREQG